MPNAAVLDALPEALEKHEPSPLRLAFHAFLDQGSTLDIRALFQNWRAAHHSGLPLYDDVVLGRTGRATANTALIHALSDGQFQIAMSGAAFEEWTSRAARGQNISSLPPDCAHILAETIAAAMREQYPVHAVAHTIRHGIVRLYDLVVLPLANRWGSPLLLAYARSRDEQYGMVDAIFASTTGGLLALAPVHNPDGVVCDFRIVAVNQGGAELVLSDAATLQWQLLSVLFPHLRETGAIDRLVTLHHKGGAVEFEFTYPGRQGLRYFLIRATEMNGLVSASLLDVSGIKQREESFKLLFQDSPLPMFVYDRQSLAITDINDAAAAHYGYARADFLALSILDIRPEEDRQRVVDTLASGDVDSSSGETWRHVKASGELMEVKVYSREVVHHGTPSRLAVVVDVTEQRKTEARITFMAHHDALTGLPNRVMFLDELRRTLSRVRSQERSAAVICIDLDFFKDVNDTLGHPAGDQLLREVSHRLRKCTRDNDLVARLGGDEFCIIQRDLAEPGEAGKLAERLIATLSKPFEIDGHQVVIGASMGIALAPNDGETAEDVLKNADMALYRSKDDGRGLFRYFQSEMDARMRARRALEVELRRALVAGEFELNYQPFVSTTTNAVTGFEALLRWRNPERGMVPPAEFIPLAEEIGLITPIGEWVLRQACAEAATWPKPIRVAVNLSAVQFKGNKLAAVVASALAASGLPASRLELEITESVLLRNSEANLATLHQLRALGVRISMDDFGTGYSSLSYLRSFPFDKIKIDQSFIREMGNSSGDAAIVSAVTGLGISLGISTTAEGVETAEQLSKLKDEGCTEVQGYYLGRPMPAHDVHQLLDEQKHVATSVQ